MRVLFDARPGTGCLTGIGRYARTVASVLPPAYFVLYFTVVYVRYGFGWTFTFVSGSVILCGVIGLLLSFVALPPAGSAAE